MSDEAHLRRCLELAEQYRGRTSPNPIVGAVVVGKGGKVLAEGAHRGPGTLHGEADALAKLGGKAAGATLYCNLEPCRHHGRTPPCTDAIKAAGIARVVYGSADPIAGHGGGARVLRAAGIALGRGLVDECDRANLPFLTWAVHHRPAFTAKAGISLDGKIATADGESKWITSDEARADAMRERDRHDGILVGIGTVLADDPRLNVRGVPNGRDPVRIVLDRRLRTPPDAALLKGGRAIIFGGYAKTVTGATLKREQALVKAGATVYRVTTLEAMARKLGELGLTSVLVEGGGMVHAAMFAADLVDRAILYVAPIVIGGSAAPSWVGGEGLGTLAHAHKRALRWVGARNVGPDLRLDLER